jgi:hypothetical protein
MYFHKKRDSVLCIVEEGSLRYWDCDLKKHMEEEEEVEEQQLIPILSFFQCFELNKQLGTYFFLQTPVS